MWLAALGKIKLRNGFSCRELKQEMVLVAELKIYMGLVAES